MTRIMGIDLGDRRIGLALSDETRTIASPRGTIASIGPRQDVNKVAELAKADGVAELVVGVATRLDGTPSAQGEKAIAFATRLRSHCALPVHTWDESLSTADAMEAMVAAGRRRRDRRDSIDAEAAAMILRGFLDARSRTQRESPTETDYRPRAAVD